MSEDRSTFLLRKYWDVYRAFIESQAGLTMNLSPHPMMKMTLHLRERIRGCLTEIADEALAKCFEEVLTCDPDESPPPGLTLADLWDCGVQQVVVQAEKQLLELEARSSSPPFQLLYPEELFIEQFEGSLALHNDKMRKMWAKRLARIDGTAATCEKKAEGHPVRDETETKAQSTLGADVDGPDYIHDDTLRLAKRLAERKASIGKAVEEVSRAATTGLHGPGVAAEADRKRLAAEAEDIQKIIDRVEHGHTYFERWGFEEAIDACGEVTTWIPLSEAHTSEDTDGLALRVPVEGQDAYAQAVAARLFDAFVVCCSCEPSDYSDPDSDYSDPDGEVVYARYDLFAVLKTPNSPEREALFFLHQWHGAENLVTGAPGLTIPQGEVFKAAWGAGRGDGEGKGRAENEGDAEKERPEADTAAAASEVPQQLEKLFQDKDGAIWAVLDSEKKLLFPADCRRPSKAREICELLCLERLRNVNAEQLRAHFEIVKVPPVGTIKGWAGKMRALLKKAFVDRAANWKHIVRTEKDVIVIDVRQKPYTDVIERCPKCKREYQPSDDHLSVCPSCETPRNKKRESGRRLTYDEATDEVLGIKNSG